MENNLTLQKEILVHISQITSGDTIIHNGKLTTVSTNNIKIGGFMGKTLFGDSYNLGYKLVNKVVFNVPKLGK